MFHVVALLIHCRVWFPVATDAMMFLSLLLIFLSASVCDDLAEIVGTNTKEKDGSKTVTTLLTGQIRCDTICYIKCLFLRGYIYIYIYKTFS